MKYDFGKIYQRPTPLFGLYSIADIDCWGSDARPISHHWDRAKAEAAKLEEETVRNMPCVIIEYEQTSKS